MRIKDGFLLRKVGKEQLVVAVGAAAERLSGFIRLNAAGVFLWKLLEQGAEQAALAEALVKEYGIPAEQAAADVAAFLEQLRAAGCLEEA